MPAPTIRHPGLFILGIALRKRRHARGLHQPDITQKMGINPGTLSRWEDGYRRIPEDSLRWLLGLLETPPADYHFLLGLHKLCERTSHVEHSTPGMTGLHRAYHQHAQHILEWAPHVIPDHLHTPAYAHHVTTAHAGGPNQDATARPAHPRGPNPRSHYPDRGQTLLLGATALTLKAIPQPIRQEQLDRVIAVTQSAQREVRIVPASFADTIEPFTIYEIATKSSTVVLRSEHTTIYLSDPASVTRYLATFATLDRHSTDYTPAHLRHVS